MEDTSPMDFDHYSAFRLHFIPYEATNPAPAFSFDEGGREKILTGDFDYEEAEPGFWRLHIDFSLKVNHVAEIIIRNSFSVEADDEQLFTKETMISPLNWALTTCLSDFKEQCEEYDLEEVPVSEDMFGDFITELAEDFSDQYFTIFKPADIDNLQCSQLDVLHLEPAPITALAIHCTFKVLDEIMFVNPAFNHDRNQAEISKVVPLNKYFTLKIKSLAIDEESVHFNLIELFYLFTFMDVALQMLVGDHFDDLEEALEKASFTSDARNAYIKYTSGMLRDFKAHLKKIDSSFRNLEVSYDWNALIG